MKSTWQSNTVRLGLVQILGAVVGYLNGQIDLATAITTAVLGAIQVGQRLWSLQSEAASAGADAASSPQG